MNVCILVSTINKGILSVPNLILDKKKFINYVISHQLTSEEYRMIPKELLRDDIKISQIQGEGVTKSRNNAIKISDSDIGLFSDDDVLYQLDWIENLRKKFEDNADLDVAIFKIKTFPGEPEYKMFPNTTIEYKIAPSVGTVQIAIRINKIKQNNIQFDERFGAGNKYLIGSDEQIFIHDCIKKGLKVVYYPEYIVQHKYISTIKQISKYDPRLCRLVGGIDARINGWKSLPKSFFGTIRYIPDLISNKKNPFSYFVSRFIASCYILITNNRFLKCKN